MDYASKNPCLNLYLYCFRVGYKSLFIILNKILKIKDIILIYKKIF
jgi:hypothetical protein